MADSGRRRRNGFMTWEPGSGDGSLTDGRRKRAAGRAAEEEHGAGPGRDEARSDGAQVSRPAGEPRGLASPFGAPDIGGSGGPANNAAVGEHERQATGAEAEPGAGGGRSGMDALGGRHEPGRSDTTASAGGDEHDWHQRSEVAPGDGRSGGSPRDAAAAGGSGDGRHSQDAADRDQRGADRDGRSPRAGRDSGQGRRLAATIAGEGADADDRGYPGDRGRGSVLNGRRSGPQRRDRNHGRAATAAAERDDRVPPQPGVTMAKSHLSSAPPELGPVRRSLDENKAILDAVMGVGTSFDVIFRELRFGDTRVAVYVVNGMYETVSNLVLMNMTEWLTDLGARRQDLPPAETGASALHALFQARLAFAQVTKTKRLDDVAFNVMAGPLAILVDGADEAIIVDTREYPDRLPDEPVTERVTRGPHDGFIETLVYNTTLIRRRIRDPRLHFAIQQAGVRSQMDVAVGYIDGLTDPALVKEVQRRIKSIDIDEITMAERTVAEYLARSPWNPFPTTRMTERPDVAAFHLLEGHVVVLVDTTPQAIICPATFWNHLQHPEDFHLSPFMGTYMRWVQFIGLAFATLVPPLWLVIAIDPRIVHALPALAFIGPKKTSGFPLGLQFIGAEVTLDLLRRAILNTPGSLSATMGILGAIVLGDVAAKTGIFSSEVLVYIVLAAIGQFAVSNLELGMAARIVRLTLLVAVWALRLPGLLIGTLIWLLVLLGTRTFGIPYTWPLLPFDWGAFRGMLIREPAHARGQRPLVLQVQNRSRR